MATGSRHVVRDHDHVVVRAWPASVAAVRYRIDDGAWEKLLPAGNGHWSGPLPGDRLAKGEHVLEVVAVAQDAAEGCHPIGFMVDPTGRYTPIPEVRPVVTSARSFV